MMNKIIQSYNNGNSSVKIYEDGTRIINYDDKMDLEFPLNIDIRVMTKCAFGYNKRTGKAICSFCHESAQKDGVECDYRELLWVLKELPPGVELAIGANEVTAGLRSFLSVCSIYGWVCNLTINQGHINRDSKALKELIDRKYIYGLGISYRPNMLPIPKYFVENINTVVHVICGIDNFDDVLQLRFKMGVKKILILGEKDFGFNSGKVNTDSPSHQKWQRNVSNLFEVFDVVSFDNLAVEQLDIVRFFDYKIWEEIYQGEHSIYINAVDKTFSKSSRSPDKTDWSVGIKEFFNTIEKERMG